MTNHELGNALGCTFFEEGLERPVVKGYCGDLLSWVMGRAPKDGVWVTVMTNQNVAAVAVLCDVSCVVLAQGASPDEALAARAKREELCILRSEEDAFTLCARIDRLLHP